jgi:hypothetical protein
MKGNLIAACYLLTMIASVILSWTLYVRFCSPYLSHTRHVYVHRDFSLHKNAHYTSIDGQTNSDQTTIYSHIFLGLNHSQPNIWLTTYSSASMTLSTKLLHIHIFLGFNDTFNQITTYSWDSTTLSAKHSTYCTFNTIHFHLFLQCFMLNWTLYFFTYFYNVLC